MQRGLFTKLSRESKFSRKYACWAQNHVKPWASFKTRNRRLARTKLKRMTQAEAKGYINEGE